MLRIIVVAATCALCVALPATAAGQNAPPGNSGVDQYLETVPDAGGDRTPQGGGVEGDQGAQDGSSLPAGTTRRLEAVGDEGAALERLVASSEPRGARAPGRTARAAGAASAESAGGESHEPRTPRGRQESEVRRSLPEAVTTTSLTGSGSGGLGLLLPALLALTTLGSIALALRSRRS